ncbi:MAG: nucleotidyl transferase AbiEii/AbiGii toxin family protein [Clostridiales bacterium]|nr:nucleotidyl transferase AbiEii/AbiGii toxin family protein [Clostridiales bacterium]
MLFKNEQEFKELVEATGKQFNLTNAYVEKDYYVTLLLKELSQKVPGLLFKGGTSLSKCFHIIDRFSEDIDLTLDLEHFTQGNKRKANKTIIEVCDSLGFKILNEAQVINHSHANYNLYQVGYPAIFNSPTIKPYLQVEIVFIQKAYPSVRVEVGSYIREFIDSKNEEKIREYNLGEFFVLSQSLERTFIDKVFAICDYYLREVPTRNSRHIYDLSRLLSKIDINDTKIKELVAQVREDRKRNKTSLSSQDNININKVLADIIQTAYFDRDYNETTKVLLIKPCEYKEVIGALQTIIDSKLFV